MFKCDFGDEYLPRRGTKNSAGYDFYAVEDIEIKAGQWTKVDTHIHLEKGSLADNQVMIILPRSSTGFKYGLRIRNTAGVIDADYSDNIHAMLSADEDIVIRKGDRYMQGIIIPYFTLENEISPINERSGGIGSTGN